MKNNSFNDISDTIGVDEVGRGAWCGPVVACAILLKPSILSFDSHKAINDSKKISKKQRENLEIFIKKHSIFSYGISVANEIDSSNIKKATEHAMKRACKPFLKYNYNIKIDGPNFFYLNKKTQFIIKGDQKSISIASASILAKVYRDRVMTNYSKLYPFYAWENNMGYGTKKHILGIIEHGLSPIHRLSFSPMKNINTHLIDNGRTTLTSKPSNIDSANQTLP